MSAAKDVATILDTALSGFTVGTNLFWGRGLTDTPDTQIGVVTYAGGPPELAMTGDVGSAIAEMARVQVVSRAAAYQTAEDNAQLAWNALQNYKGTVNGNTILFVTCLQSPFSLGPDGRNLMQVAFNVEVWTAS